MMLMFSRKPNASRRKQTDTLTEQMLRERVIRNIEINQNAINAAVQVC